jgi:hypothetical protein
MDKRMADALDRHITGNYGEDQFKNEPIWKMGDRYRYADEDYILARTILPIEAHDDPEIFHFQFIGTKSGNRLSDKVIVRRRELDLGDAVSLSLEEILELFEADDDFDLNKLEECHVYGPEW